MTIKFKLTADFGTILSIGSANDEVFDISAFEGHHVVNWKYNWSPCSSDNFHNNLYEFSSLLSICFELGGLFEMKSCFSTWTSYTGKQLHIGKFRMPRQLDLFFVLIKANLESVTAKQWYCTTNKSLNLAVTFRGLYEQVLLAKGLNYCWFQSLSRYVALRKMKIMFVFC